MDIRCVFGHAYVERFREHHEVWADGWGFVDDEHDDVFEECRHCRERRERRVNTRVPDPRYRWLAGEDIDPVLQPTETKERFND